MFDLRILCGNSHSSFLFSLYKYPPVGNPQAGAQPSFPPKAQARRSSSGYTAVSFSSDKEGAPSLTARDGAVSVQKDGLSDASKVCYTEVNVPHKPLV